MNSPTSSSDRSFGLTFVAVFGLIALWLLWNGKSGAFVLASLGGLTLAISITRPSLLKPFNRAWIALGNLLHRFVSPIVLGMMYFVVFTSVGVLMRLMGRDPMNKCFQPDAKSYWVDRDPPGPATDSFSQQF